MTPLTRSRVCKMQYHKPGVRFTGLWELPSITCDMTRETR